MQNIVFNEQDGVFYISGIFDINAPISSPDYAPKFDNINDEHTIIFNNLQNIKKITNFNYKTIGTTKKRYLQSYYRLSNNGTNWSEWAILKKDVDNYPSFFESFDNIYLEIKWVREGSNNTGEIRLTEYYLEGEIKRNVDDDDNGIVVIKPGETVILKPPYIYKVFKIVDLEIISLTNINDVEIKYRFSQDNSRTWSNWEYLTKENITTVRINPIRFFQIEYSITNNSNDTVVIQDINLIGDFQNVSKDYFKTNLYGIRECCRSNIVNMEGDCDPDVNDLYKPMTEEEKMKLYNPYAQSTAINLLNKLSYDSEQIFGHRVLYFLTDPDKKGQDHTLNEYQLYNVVCYSEIKVSVEGNNFPDSKVTMDQFGLNLFDSMEAHITKKQFKEVFGPHRRPSKEDYLYFCDLNRMYIVDYSQQYRSFNNSAIYYKLILKKYTQKANVQPSDKEIENVIYELTKNSTIDELFGEEIEKDKRAVANKDQFKTLTKDPIRLEYLAELNNEIIENSYNIISKSNYDLSSVTYGTPAVKYKNVDSVLNVSDNIGFIIWFNLYNYVLNETYNFFNFYDNNNLLGWKVNLINDTINVHLNSTTYIFNLTQSAIPNTIALNEDVWYCYVLNIEQRNKKMYQWIYKRNVDDEMEAPNLPNSKLKMLYKDEKDIEPVHFELDENINAEILASDMKVTNIRLFKDIIPETEHNKILNQYIIRDDSKYLIFADNANKKLYLPNMPLGNE